MNACRTGLVIAASALAAISAAGTAGAESDADLLDRVRDAYRSIETLQATFEQENDWDLLGETASYRGELTVSTDGRVRIEYVEPPGHVFVADGRWLWTYVPESGQVLKSHPGDDRSELSRLFLDFLAGNRVIDIARHETGADISLATDDTSSLRELMVTVNLATGLGTNFTWTDAEGNTARYRFVSTRINRPLASGAFDFQPPAGVEVIELRSGR